MKYQLIEQLQCHKTQLRDTIALGAGVQFAAWSNSQDLVSVCGNHHTLSLYVRGGSDCYQKTPSGWRNGGGPGRFCLLPQDDESTWHIRGRLDFIHLYYSDEHLRRVAAHVWDREPASLELPPLAFSEDGKIHSLYQMFIVNCDWADKANHLQMSSCAVLLLSHLVRCYSNVKWEAPRIKGGLAPVTLCRVRDWIEANLEQRLTLAELATQACLSEYHFARMFQQSTRMSPHQFVMQRRLAKAKELVQTTTYPLVEIAWRCGFSSAAHLSHRFKRQFGLPPSAMRSVMFDSCV